jgi:exosome complex component RRP42
MSNEIIAELRKDYIYNLMIKGEREDGRAFDQYRNLVIETNVINKAEGSARVKLGDTHVVVGVKIQPGTPFPDHWHLRYLSLALPGKTPSNWHG